MRTIVVGVDRSHSASAVGAWAGGLAARVDAELVVANALDIPWAETSPVDLDRLLEERERDVEQQALELAAQTGARVRSVVRAGDPRKTLNELAEEEDADLLVLGRAGEGASPGFLHLGSVTEYVAHHWSRPLAVVPVPAPAVERIVVGVDGSADAAAAVAWCAEMAPVLGAEVVAVHVEEPIAEWTPASSPDNWRRGAEHRVEEWTAPLVDAGVEVRGILQCEIRPADALLGVASAVDGDLLVVGMRGLGGFTGLRAGGVALKALHRASLPLVMVPATQ